MIPLLRIYSLRGDVLSKKCSVVAQNTFNAVYKWCEMLL